MANEGRIEGRRPEYAAKDQLGAFALQVLRPTWIGAEPEAGQANAIAWEGLGVKGVPICALRAGFIIFQFEQSDEYSGGAVPAYILPEDMKVPGSVTAAERARDELGYERFIYMNAFLFSLYSAIPTIQHRSGSAQAPIDPNNYFKAVNSDGVWQIYCEPERRVEIPNHRHDNIEIETLNHTVEVLERCSEALRAPCLDILSMIYLACSNYACHRFSLAHLIAWTSIERLLSVKWMNLQADVDAGRGGHTRINKNRRNLLNGRDFTASIVSQVLSICGKIDDQTLVRLDEARKKRNAFAHNLVPIEYRDAGKALRLTTDMITEMAGIRVTSQLGFHTWM